MPVPSQRIASTVCANTVTDASTKPCALMIATPMQLLHVLMSVACTVVLGACLALPGPPLPLLVKPTYWTSLLYILVVYIGLMDAGNHEYDYRTGKEKHSSHNKDPSGAGSPYEPDWGNYGTASSQPALVHRHCNRSPCGSA